MTNNKTHKYNTRFGNNLRKPKQNTNIVRHKLKFISAKVWNQIPTEIINFHSNSIFKSHIKSISSYNSMMHLAQPLSIVNILFNT